MNIQSNIVNSPLYKQYSDSVNKYLKLHIDYITAHHKDSDLFGDKHLKYLVDKQNEFNDKRAALLNQSENSLSLFEDEKAQETIRFRKATIVEIFFQFNESVGIINGGDAEVQVANYKFPGTVAAKSVHILDPDPYSTPWHFDQWENIIVLLLGNWIRKPAENKNYDAAFNLYGQADEHTPKKIKSDKVQTIAIHIMGNHQNTSKIMSFIDVNKLNNLLVKN